MTPDYLPLTPGLRLDYEVRRAGGTLRLEIDLADAGDGGVSVIRTWTSPDGSTRTETSRRERRADGIYEDGLLVLPLPPDRGRAWVLPPNRWEIEGAGEVAEVPAGRFPNCLKASCLIAGGDGGSGCRLYAPGVGIVSELCADEADPFEAKLVARRLA
jgi:hypothetical protein